MALKGDVKRIRVKYHNEPESLENLSQLHIIRCEEKLAERLNKAVTHLAIFCPKTKETF
ncbi:MAG: hypothetical protein JWR72_1182 [Flavisolibacter sp.]|jgi:hypothetical protein|nr:hypothetical protein [Flavisolibacter sp.]